MTEICSNCKCVCRGQWIDFGNETTEFWGVPKTSPSNFCWVSNCCEDDVLDDEGNVEEGIEPEQREYNREDD
jgi:hypothetical protein